MKGAGLRKERLELSCKTDFVSKAVNGAKQA